MGRGSEEREKAEQCATKYNRMHQFAYGKAKAGMKEVNDDKMATLMHNTQQNNEKYFSKQE